MDIKIRRKGKGNARFFNAYILFKILDQLLSVNIKDIDRFPQAAFFQDFFPRDIGGPYDADFPNMKTRTMDQEPKESKGNQEGKERAAVDSELALLAVGGYERKSWQVNPYFNKREDFVGSGLPSFLVCRLDGLTPDTCMRLVAEPANVEKKGLWGWAVVDRGGPYAQGDRWLDDVFERVREAGIPAYLDDWPQTLPEKFPLSRDTALYCGWYAGNANGPFSDPSFRFRPGAIAMHLHSFSAADFKVPGRGWSSALLEKGAAVTVGNVYEPFLGACHRFDIFVDRLLDGYTVAEASWMSMPVLSWQGLVFGDPLYRPYARMKDMDVEPTEEDRYFQGWWASSVQFGDRWKDRSARLMESARKAPFSCLYEALALECLYRKEPARAGELLSSALDGAADARTRARLLLEILMAERARGGNKAFLQRADGIRGLMSSSAFLPALEEWLARVAPPPDPPEK